MQKARLFLTRRVPRTQHGGRPMTTSRRISPKHANTIREGLASGRTLRSIAAELELAPSTVLRWARRAGLVANARVSRPVSRVDVAPGTPSPTRATKARSRGRSGASQNEPECANVGHVGDEHTELLEVAGRLKALLADAGALAPADVARVSAELRATLKRLGVVRDAARAARESDAARAAGRVRARLEAIVASQQSPVTLVPDAAEEPPPAEEQPTTIHTPARASLR